MTLQRLHEILAGFVTASIAVIGDFFLDKYLEIDPALSETSLETGMEARQVVGVRCQPGAAGTIVSNLRALGIANVRCIGFVGDDGEGFDLVRALQRLGADTSGILVRQDRFTPTYCKPIVNASGNRVQELERLDTRNRTPLSPDLQEDLAAELERSLPSVTAVIAQDQVPEQDCGVISLRIREALAASAASSPATAWFGDSRARIGLYRNLIVKPNRDECCAAIHPGTPSHRAPDVYRCAAALSRQVGRPVYLTLGADGMAVITSDTAQPIPTVQLTGEIDIVGAGDSATAGIVAALCAGATLTEAGIIGNIVASITVQQIGTTGVATQQQIRDQFTRHESVWRDLPPSISL